MKREPVGGHVVSFACPKELAEWLAAEAARDGRKLSDWLRRHFTTIREKASKRRGRK